MGAGPEWLDAITHVVTEMPWMLLFVPRLVDFFHTKAIIQVIEGHHGSQFWPLGTCRWDRKDFWRPTIIFFGGLPFRRPGSCVGKEGGLGSGHSGRPVQKKAAPYVRLVYGTRKSCQSIARTWKS